LIPPLYCLRALAEHGVIDLDDLDRMRANFPEVVEEIEQVAAVMSISGPNTDMELRELEPSVMLASVRRAELLGNENPEVAATILTEAMRRWNNPSLLLLALDCLVDAALWESAETLAQQALVEVDATWPGRATVLRRMIHVQMTLGAHYRNAEPEAAWRALHRTGSAPRPLSPDLALLSLALAERFAATDQLVSIALVECRCLVVVSLAGRILSGRSLFCRTRTVAVPSRMKRPVVLTGRDREELIRLTRAGVWPASMIARARVLLALDTSTGEIDAKEAIAARLGVSGETLRLVAKRFAETGGDAHATIARKVRGFAPVPSAVTGEVEARLIALACSQPPPGYARWSLRLLEKHVALTEDIPDLDHSTIGRVLKKRNCVLI
jgi:transposase